MRRRWAHRRQVGEISVLDISTLLINGLRTLTFQEDEVRRGLALAQPSKPWPAHYSSRRKRARLAIGVHELNQGVGSVIRPSTF